MYYKINRLKSKLKHRWNTADITISHESISFINNKTSKDSWRNVQESCSWLKLKASATSAK